MKIDIIGAGMSGLLAGAMLREDCGTIFEAQSELPNNHSAVLRFRTSAVSDALNIPFKKVKVMKSSHPWMNSIADAMAYSMKTNGTPTLRSIVNVDGNISDRFIAPPDLIDRMGAMVKSRIEFNHSFDFSLRRPEHKFNPLISTMPMPVLMKALNYPLGGSGYPLRFPQREGFNVTATILGANAYCSLYIPDPRVPASRISITGDQLIVECYADFDSEHEKDPKFWRELATLGCGYIGLPQVDLTKIELKRQKYAKILPIDEDIRKKFILWASEEHGIYSLGRFATWRPGLMMDDVVNDVRVIHRLINGGSSYAAKKG